MSTNEDFPLLIKDLPKEIQRTIINFMNYVESDNDWKELTMRIWPKIIIVDIRYFEENGKMTLVLEEWGHEGGTTKELLQTLKSMKRIDLLMKLKEDYPSIR